MGDKKGKKDKARQKKQLDAKGLKDQQQKQNKKQARATAP